MKRWRLPGGRAGFSITEMLVASALLGLLILAAQELLQRATREAQDMADDTSLKTDGTLTLQQLQQLLVNGAAVDPAEPAIINGAPEYRGVMGLQDNDVALPCTYGYDLQQGEFKSVLRLTTLLSPLSSGRTLRAWDEKSAGFYDAAHQLRVAAANAEEGAFLRTATELLLVDADGLVSRRYPVHSAQHVITSLDPYTDQPPVGNGPTSFQYESFALDLATMPTGDRLVPATRWFVTGSMVYPARTQLVCINPEGNLVRTEPGGATEVLFNAKAQNAQITSFRVTYTSSATNPKLDPAAFVAYRDATPAQRECLNVVYVRMRITPASTRLGLKPTDLDRMVVLFNLNDRLPSRCLPPSP
jgi:prepilin-type N-terminal cleavage/methylation domain-containing protein